MNAFEFAAVQIGRVITATLVAMSALVAFSLMIRPAEAALAGQREKAAVSAVNGFAVDVYKKFAEEGRNLCFSPYSISTAFAMTYAGAKGETAAEMQRAFHYGTDIHGANRVLMGNLLNSPAGAGELRIANSIWPAKGLRLSMSFENTIHKDYFSEVLPQDYRRQPERSRRAINDWVAEKTRERILNILPQGSVKADTKMVLVNAIYFKAPWMSEFSEGKTADADFYVSRGEKTNVRMMNNIDTFQYADFEGVQVLKLPYRQGVFSMLLLLPREKDGLEALEEKLLPAEIERYQTELGRRKVNVFLPKFKVEQTFDLIPTLMTLGVKDAFDAGVADFSGIAGRRDLYINAAVHKAFVEVDEAGTEAAAATAIGMRLTSAPMRKPEEIAIFRADHPFIYIIQDELSGAILFMGKVAKP